MALQMFSVQNSRIVLWGAKLKKDEKPILKFEHECHVTSAQLECDVEFGKDETVSVIFQYNNTDYLLCELHSNLEMFHTHDLCFKPGEVVKFFHNGKGIVHLGGFQLEIYEKCYLERNLDHMLTCFKKMLDKDKNMEEENDVSGSKKSKKHLVDKKSENPTVKITGEDKTEDEYDVGVSSLSVGKDGASKPSSKLLAGVAITDIVVGHGQEAKEGSKVEVYSTGKFANDKVFELIHGVPYKFQLGQSGVIKGWNIGLEGMKVGGKRNLVIQPEMGYGSTIVGNIPANSTLFYEVELVSVN